MVHVDTIAMIPVIKAIAISTFFVSCGDFEGAQTFKSNSQAGKPTTVPREELNGNPISTGQPTITGQPTQVGIPGEQRYQDLVAGNSDQKVCATGDAKSYVVGTGAVPSSHREAWGKDVVFSQVFEFHISNIKGNVLPVTSFAQDDVVIAVPATTTEADMVKFEGQNKVIHVPEHAVLVASAGTAGFADGQVDDGQTIIYQFSDNTRVSLPGGQSRKLSEIYDLAPKITQSDDLRLSKFDKDSYITGGFKKIAFKFALVPHGIGSLHMIMTVPACE